MLLDTPQSCCSVTLRCKQLSRECRQLPPAALNPVLGLAFPRLPGLSCLALNPLSRCQRYAEERVVQEEAGWRRRAVAESLAVQSKPQRKEVIIVLNFIRTAWLVAWAEPALEPWFSRWEEGRSYLHRAEEQEILLPCSPSLSPEALSRSLGSTGCTCVDLSLSLAVDGRETGHGCGVPLHQHLWQSWTLCPQGGWRSPAGMRKFDGMTG